MQIIEDAQKLIDSIGEECPKVSESLQTLLDRVAGIQNLCAEEADAKDTLFDEMAKALKEALENCPGKEKEIAELGVLFDQGQQQECGGSKK